jgi:sigma-B regulation protein RsbU (phosphoserine phosphatase)
MCKIVGEAERKNLETNRKQIKLLFGSEFSSNVLRKGEIIGTVMAQVNPEKALSRILLHSLRQEEGIPFAVDMEGSLYTADPADRDKLKGLPIQEVTCPPGSTSPRKTELENWIVVTRKDPDSGLSFGIARPIRQGMEEIRRTAARNFSYGLGMMGLALVGIMPLSGRLTRNLNQLTQGAEQMARGDLNVQVPVRSHDELGRLAATFNRMVRDLRDNQQHLLEQERLRKELEMCRRIQEELLPRAPLRIGLAEMKGLSIPASEVGGDFFNYFSLPDGSIALLVGDVSGKGVPAALLMANLQATLRARLPLERDLAMLAGLLDWEIASSTPPEVYLTLFMGILDVEKGDLHYVNAGHNTQYVLHCSQGLERLDSTGRPLGLLPGGGYGNRRVTLAEGDSLFLYTDGLVEAENETGDEFGCTRLEEVLVAEHTQGLDHLIAKVDQVVRAHRGSREARDDATILALRVRQS